MISACITFQLDNEPKQIFSIKNADFTWMVENDPSVIKNNVAALSLLDPVFSFKTNSYWDLTTQPVDRDPDLSFFVGELVDAYNYPNHAIQSLSLVSFTKFSAIEHLARELPPGFHQSYNDWGNMLRGKTTSQVNSILDEYYPIGLKRLVTGPKTLYIHKTSPSELSSRSIADDVTYTDGYDLVADCINNYEIQNVALQKARIESVSSYPVIVFETEAIIITDRSAYDNDPPPVNNGDR